MFDKTIRVFLSSTFKDFRAERDALHLGAFHSLRQHCEENGFQFHVIDLRWGVHEEAAWDQRTESICLDEIRRCRLVTPRPNFVALVGQRYGWRPLPAELSMEEWDRTKPQAGSLTELLENWYQLDENNRPPVYRLRRRVSKDERDPQYWASNVEAPLRTLLINSRISTDVDVSLTEKEVRLGAENANQNSWEAFAYFREIVTRHEGERLGEPWVDLDTSGQPADPNAEQKLAAMRRRLELDKRVTTRDYKSRVMDGEVDGDSLRQLNDMVEADLRLAIDREMRRFHEEDDLDREARAQSAFGEQRQTNYVARPQVESRAHAYLGKNARYPLIFHGASGSGKTALVATLRAQVARRYPDRLCVTRFIGATGDSSALRTLARSVHAEIARETGSPDASDAMVGNPQVSFRTALQMGTEDKPVVLLLDALDQLSPDDHALSCRWIPRELPEHCHLIATCMTGEEEKGQTGEGVFSDLAGRLDPESIAEVIAPSPAELRSMLSQWLGYYGRTLTEQQRAAADKAIQACPRPLFLRVLVELARRWTTDRNVGELPSSIPAIIELYLEFAESEREHGRALVEGTLGLLAASRSGLTESELVELLGRDRRILDQFSASSRYEYPDQRDRLPPAVWSRLLFDLGFFLGEASAAGVSLMTFYHRQLAFVANRRYVQAGTRDYHSLIAAYLAQLPAWHDEAGGAPHTRRAYELPYQLRSSADRSAGDRLIKLLSDPRHVAAKISAGLRQDLLVDFAEVENVEGAEIAGLVRFFKAEYVADDTPLSRSYEPGDLHAFLAYRGKAIFYRALLESLATGSADSQGPRGSRLRFRAQADLGGMLRREDRLEEARSMLRAVGEDAPEPNKADLGVGWYEVGYVHYMDDEYDAAATAMERGVRVAEEGHDRVGAAMSRSVEIWSRYLGRPDENSLEQIIEEEQAGLQLFTDEQAVDPRALRWVMNSLVHLVNAAYLLNDRVRAENFMRDLRANPWIREFESREYLLQYEARLEMLRGRFDQAVATWERFFEWKPVAPDAQAGAWLKLDFGLALIGSGRIERAAEVFRAGLALRSRGCNNAHWQARIREEYRRLTGEEPP